MAFLSLGLHNDEPPTASEREKNESPREPEGNGSAHEFGIGFGQFGEEAVHFPHFLVPIAVFALVAIRHGTSRASW